MKIGEDLKVEVGEDGIILLREPTNKEWNNFTKNRFITGKGRAVTDTSTKARADLFDILVKDIKNLEDNTGPITLETKERLPHRIKADVILNAFEADVVDVKNS